MVKKIKIKGEAKGSASNQAPQPSYDLSFKILLIGDSAVGKSSLLLTFISNSIGNLSPTIGVDFKIKFLTVGEKTLKLTIWDTAGQERFRTVSDSYYRGAHGIILVYDVTNRETFADLSNVWAKEVGLYSTNENCVKMLVGNKVDIDSERAVSKEEGMSLANELGSLFLECSAKTRENVDQCFEELALKIMENPSLLEEGSHVKKNILKQKQEQPPTPPPPPQNLCIYLLSLCDFDFNLFGLVKKDKVISMKTRPILELCQKYDLMKSFASFIIN
ncbi:uncharacterized protein [Phyllobates terribilis]|uniref:uncharacterized protein n=1 Tax=Phyllobates terribilis TaxID=111132 RepID=UPI003CCB4CDE